MGGGGGEYLVLLGGHEDLADVPRHAALLRLPARAKSFTVYCTSVIGITEPFKYSLGKCTPLQVQLIALSVNTFNSWLIHSLKS